MNYQINIRPVTYLNWEGLDLTLETEDNKATSVTELEIATENICLCIRDAMRPIKEPKHNFYPQSVNNPNNMNIQQNTVIKGFSKDNEIEKKKQETSIENESEKGEKNGDINR